MDENACFTVLNAYMEGRFIENELCKIFCIDDEALEKLIADVYGSCKVEKRGLSNKEILENLPFFKMCKAFGEILREFAPTTNKGAAVKERHNCNPFAKAMWALANRDKIYSEKLREMYFKDFDSSDKNGAFAEAHFNLIRHENGEVSASNWYKLAYMHTCSNTIEKAVISIHENGATYRMPLFVTFFYTDPRFNNRAWVENSKNLLPDSEWYKSKVSYDDSFTKGICDELNFAATRTGYIVSEEEKISVMEEMKKRAKDWGII